jgi:5-methylcytosine-specific restriction endonuclease McrA
MQPVEVLIEAAIVAMLHKEPQVARQSLQEIDVDWLTAERARALESVWGTSSTVIKPVRPPQKTARAPVRTADKRATFQRDRFTCRYAHCQRRTIDLDVLKALSRLFPDVLPYQQNWHPVQSHIVYWTWSTSLEHREAFPFGGTSEPENLLTACYQCNDIKNSLPLEALGWRLTEPATSDWDGLRRYKARQNYLGLCHSR